jgi:DNA-binding MarR family transcriptional regulator
MGRATGERNDEYPVDCVATLPAAAIAAAWRRELPGVPTASIEVITPLWRAAKALADDRRHTLARLGVEPATLDLLSTLRRAGPPYALTTREVTERSLITAGAVSQRIARAERAGLVTRSGSAASRRAVAVELTAAGHDLIETTVRDLLTHEETLIDSLTADERGQLGTLLKKLSDANEQPA